MMKVQADLDSRLTEGGYIRQKDTEAGARYTREGNTIIVSGPQVLVCSGGLWQAFETDRAIKLGVQMMERIARMDRLDQEGSWQPSLWIQRFGASS